MLLNQTIILQKTNCFALYKPSLFDEQSSDFYLSYFLENIEFIHDRSFIYGKEIITKRMICWQASIDQSFTYSGVERKATGFDKKVLEIKTLIEKELGFCFNSCLLNLYHDGAEGMGWHTDKTREFGDNTVIAIVSFGSNRFIDLRSIDKEEKHRINLENGSLFVMGGETQIHYKHQIPKQLKVKKPRISLTFRQLI